MSRPLSLLLLALLVASATAELTDKCMYCMCYVSSYGCRMPDPLCDFQGICGPWRITEPYWIDGGRLMGDFHLCTGDWTCNESTVRNYMDRYVHNPSATCETYSRTHVGGPYGAVSDSTLPYWYSVRDCLDNHFSTTTTMQTASKTKV